MDWSTFVQDVTGTWAKSAIDHRYNQPYQLQKMAMQQYGPNGAPYIEGQAGGVPVVSASASIPQSWLIIGGVIALVVLLGD